MSDLGNKKIMSANLKYYMKLKNKTRKDICADLGFVYSTLNEWVNGTAYPRIDKIEKLANYFEIKKSDLIEDKNSDKSKNLKYAIEKYSDNIIEKELLLTCTELNITQQEAILNTVKLYLK